MCHAQSGFDITGQGTILTAPATAPVTASAPSTPVAAKLSAAQLKEAAERKARTAQCVISVAQLRTSLTSYSVALPLDFYLAVAFRTRSSR